MKYLAYALIIVFALSCLAACGDATEFVGFSPRTAYFGELVTLTGTFGNVHENNLEVYFAGNAKAFIVKRNSTRVVVRVPLGAIKGPITIRYLGESGSRKQLQKTSTQQFVPLLFETFATDRSFVQVESTVLGREFCGLEKNGDLSCWKPHEYEPFGRDENKQLHLVKIGEPGQWASLAPSNASCGLSTKGSVLCWQMENQGVKVSTEIEGQWDKIAVSPLALEGLIVASRGATLVWKHFGSAMTGYTTLTGTPTSLAVSALHPLIYLLFGSEIFTVLVDPEDEGIASLELKPLRFPPNHAWSFLRSGLTMPIFVDSKNVIYKVNEWNQKDDELEPALEVPFSFHSIAGGVLGPGTNYCLLESGGQAWCIWGFGPASSLRPIELGQSATSLAMTYTGAACAVLKGGGIQCWGDEYITREQ